LSGRPALRPTLIDPNKRVEAASNQGVQVPIAVQVPQSYRGTTPISQPLARVGEIRLPVVEKYQVRVAAPPTQARCQHRRKYVQVPVAVQVSQSCGAHTQVAQVFQAERIAVNLG
jgi:hypothetical protein